MFLSVDIYLRSSKLVYLQGDEVLKVSAYDGDYANPRKIMYDFTIPSINSLEGTTQERNSKMAGYFQMNRDTGVLSLRKDAEVHHI